VTATGTGPISYQWKKGNSLITAGTGGLHREHAPVAG
jgi:hypothetical protein